MADCSTGVRISRRPTRQLCAAGHPAGRHRVKTARSRRHSVPLVELLERRLATRAGGHPGRRQQAGQTVPGVTGLLALMLFAVTRFFAKVFASVGRDSRRFCGTNDFASTLPTIAF